MENDLTKTITIQATFGSAFQRDVAMKNLTAALRALGGSGRSRAQEQQSNDYMTAQSQR